MNLGYDIMDTDDKRLEFLNIIHFLAQFNFSAVLSCTSQAEFLVMSAVKNSENLRDSEVYGISQIAESLHVSSPAVSRTITALENKGYVERYVDKFRRRSTLVRLTPLGEEVLSGERESLLRMVGHVAERMGEEKIEQFLSLSNELLFNIQQEIKINNI